MGLIQSMAGSLRAEITSADIPGFLAALAEKDIPVSHVSIEGELTVRLKVKRSDFHTLSLLCQRRGETLKLLGRNGICWTVKGLLARPLLLAGLVLLTACMLYLPTRVLFIRVEGNAAVPTYRILEAAADSGIRFGASRREVRSERMKNALLEELPQLQWAGVNTKGCVATISVREREDTRQEDREEDGVSSIVAVCDGVILSGTVTRGTGLFHPGQTVLQGQVLISGYTDLGIAIRATRAEGEVFAQTRREIRTVMPSRVMRRGERGGETVRFSLIVGKKRINLWKGSGICEGSCGRMYEEYYVTLPGGFELPLALVKETIVEYSLEPEVLPRENARLLLESRAGEYLKDQMVSGSILQQDTLFSQEEGLYLLEGEYLCTEMIGRTRQEKIGE